MKILCSSDVEISIEEYASPRTVIVPVAGGIHIIIGEEYKFFTYEQMERMYKKALDSDFKRESKLTKEERSWIPLIQGMYNARKT